MEEQHYENIEDVDNEFNGHQCIYNWASDYELELGNAAIDDISYAQKRIEFCSEYIFRYHDKSDTNIGCMKRAIAESYFRIGKKDEGENLFKVYLEETPTCGSGWIGWADEYWFFAQKENKDSAKAISILKQALEIEGLEDRVEVLSRLKDTYLELGMHEEADAIVIKTELLGKPILEMVNTAKILKTQNEVLRPTFNNPKAGRNDPCPCGSGKKYKKCCCK